MLTLGHLESFRHEFLDVAGNVVDKLLSEANKRNRMVESQSRVHQITTLASGDGGFILEVPVGKPSCGFVK